MPISARAVALAVTVALLTGVAPAASRLRAQAQSAETSPSFDVASIKQSVQPGPTGPVSPDRFNRRYITALALITYAYNLTPLQVQGAPDWASNSRFDIEAKATFRATREQMRAMVRQLLAERFNLKTHIETRDVSRHALVKARADGRLGGKIHPSDVDCPELIASRGTNSQKGIDPPQAGQLPRCVITARASACCITMVFEGEPLSRIVNIAQAQAERIVVDQTGLTGTFDFELETERTLAGAISPGQLPSVDPGPSLFAALQDQLGLRLQLGRGPVDFLVIDHVEYPTPD